LVKFKILGSLVVESDTGPLEVAGSRRKALLLRLLISANHPISDDRLLEDLWEGSPPTGASSTLASHVSLLRQVIGRDRIARRAGGYALVVDQWALDSTCFQREAEAGHRALGAGDARAACSLFSKALDRWSGPALLDVERMSWAQGERARLEELRLMSFESLVESRLILGEDHELVPTIEELVTEFPLRERFWGQLMTALYRAGRQADALRAYQRLRTMLGDELGLEPTVELVALESAILFQKPELDWQDSSLVILSGGAGRAPTPEAMRAASLEIPRRLNVLQPAVSLVGRENEMQLILNAIKRVAGDEGHEVALISGEAGQGKTALVAEAARSAIRDGAYVLFGHCEEDTATPYQLFSEALGRYVRHASEDQLVAHVEIYGSELARLVPGLAARIPDPPSSRVTDSDTQRALLFGAVVGLFVELSQRQPVLFVLDDLQWADPGSLLLLRHLMAVDEPMHLLVLGTYRDNELSLAPQLVEMLGALRRQEGVTRIELQGLDESGVVSFVETAFGSDLDDAGTGLARAIYDETDGNPFFVNEVISHLSEQGRFYDEVTGRFTADDSDVRGALPDSIRDVIKARLARLGPVTDRVLSLAAVIGRDFDLDLLARASRTSEETLLDTLEVAATAALVHELPDASGLYCFTHALIQHTMYQELGPNRRAEAHRVVAQALEDLCGDRPWPRIGELARHWLLAPQPKNLEKAVQYSRQAGDTAMGDLAPANAVGYYAQALALLSKSNSPDPELELDLAIGLGSAQRQSGDPRFREILLDAARRAADIGDTERLVAAALALSWTRMGTFDAEKVEILETALKRIPSHRIDRALLLGHLSKELTYGVPLDRRRAVTEEAFSIAQVLDDDATIIRVFVDAMHPVLIPSLIDKLVIQSRDVLLRAERLGDPALLFWAAARCRVASGCVGDVDEVDRCLAIEEGPVEELGALNVRWVHTCGLACRALVAGDTEQAERMATEGLRFGTEASEPVAAAWFASQIVNVHRQRGTLAELIPFIEETIARLPEMPVHVARLALAFTHGDQLDRAHRLLTEFTATGCDLPLDNLWMTGIACWAEVAMECGDPKAAMPILERLSPWVQLSSASGITAEGPVSHFLGGLSTVLGSYDDAERYFVQSAEFNSRVRAKFFAALTSLSWGKMLQARGLRGDVDRAQELLADALASASGNGYRRVERQAAEALRAFV
jgi:DNA-binding SARP family transcriptional activator/tetratricopeptide (TPR) repeat protein